MAKSTTILFYISGFLAFAGLGLLLCFCAPGKARIQASADNVNYTLDGNEWKYDNNIWLKPGEHILKAEKEGYLAVTLSFQIKPIRTTDLNVSLLPISSVVKNSQDADISATAVSALDKSQFIYFDEESKTIKSFSDGSSHDYLNLGYTEEEIINKVKWSSNRDRVFIQSLRGDIYSGKMITISSKTVADLANTTDIAFTATGYYRLVKKGDQVLIANNDSEILTLPSARENLEFDGNNFYAYDSMPEDDKLSYFFCPISQDCQEKQSGSGIISLFGGVGHVTALETDKKLFDIGGGNRNLIKENVSPVTFQDETNFYFMTQDSNCSIYKYDYQTSSLIYSNSELCDVNNFSIINGKLYYSVGTDTNYLDLGTTK